MMILNCCTLNIIDQSTMTGLSRQLTVNASYNALVHPLTSEEYADLKRYQKMVNTCQLL